MDAAFRDGARMATIVARDNNGKLLFLACVKTEAISPELAKIKAFTWAIVIALAKGWSPVDWWCDTHDAMLQVFEWG